MRHRHRRYQMRCYAHHSTRPIQAGKPSSRSKRRTSTGLPWIICQHHFEPAAFLPSQTVAPSSEDTCDETLRSVEAELLLGEGEPEFILSLPAIQSIAGIMYQLLRSDATYNAPAMLRRLRLIVAKHRRER